MAKFLIRARYTASGTQGAVQEGFANREAYVRSLIESVGGKTEVWYFAYGEDDVIVIIDAEPAAAVAISLAVNQGGFVQLTLTPLLTAAEMDQARARLPQYRSPGT
jgi:uncharacterized protein with GYD domain